MTFKLVGGHPAVDFVNTVGGFEPALIELIPSFADLVDWAEQTELIGPGQAGRLRTTAAHRKAATLARAHELRAHLEAVIRAELAGATPDQDHLDAIHEAHVAALAAARLSRGPAAYEWERPASDEPDSVLWPIAEQIVGLLGSADLSRVAECSTSNCRWLYVDRTKNHNRRWCSDDTCGVNARMRRYRAARRAGAAQRTGTQ